jgi:hypothetical protein
MDENKQILLIAKLETQLKKARADLDVVKKENELLKTENQAFRAVNDARPATPPPIKARHLTTRIRKDGTPKVQWGVVMDVVRRSKDLTARQLVNITGFDRYAIYAAAKRAGIKLPSPYQKK